MTEYLEQSMASLSQSVLMLQMTIDELKKESASNTNLTETLLQSVKSYELISQYDVRKAQLAQKEEIDPLMTTLTDKATKSLAKLKRELDTLEQTHELNKLRLNNNGLANSNDDYTEAAKASSIYDIDVSTDVVVMGSSTDEELAELRSLKEKRQLLQNRLKQYEE